MSIRSRMYAILTNYHDYLAFSNGGYRAEAPPSEQDSVEAIHDQVHTLLGGGGHMSFIDYAGFDPVFFLHHTMIDRCFAMWQVLNPDSFVTPRVAVSDTFTMALGQIQNANSSLTPFYKDRSGNFWSSSDVRDMRIFGYEYPETSNNNAKAREQNVIVAINRLYGPPVSGQIFKRDLDAKSISASGKYREWVANLQMPKSALGAPFSVYIFLGPFNDDPKYWSSDPNLAGQHTTFSRSESLTGNGAISSPPIVTAAIPLTDSFINHISTGDLKSLSVEDVTEWLDSNLSYRIKLLDGTEIYEEDIPDFKISIASAGVKLPDSHEDLPVWANTQYNVLDIGVSSLDIL
ncbi:Tyrosinase [Golovinomyces cichoracearum]|uniref:Tyrosinase n=1 Tax=Golovinomyces cichoracearum TaxID=62708 RepID=A0A420J390_9PEZI|nr:Tyrosinase [Golovinomyces cichoracearum]